MIESMQLNLFDPGFQLPLVPNRLSPLAERIYKLIQDSKSYLAVWTIAEMLEIELPANFCGSGEWTESDSAMKELVDGGYIEELSDLHCRYRLVAN